jgi:hypothetical protein
MIQSKTYSLYEEESNKEYKFTITSAYKIKDCNKLKHELYFNQSFNWEPWGSVTT